MTKVLVVDDTPDMVRLMMKAVEDQGHETLVASDGRLALHLVSAEHPDVILLDIMMPGMSGIEVLRHLKQDVRFRMIPVIFVTAMGEERDVIAGLDEGAHDYVTKPFKKEILAARIRSAVRIKESHDRLAHLNQQLQKEMVARERMQRELAQAQKLESIGHLAAGLAHEINTPAQYVGDNTRFLQEAFTGFDGLLRVSVNLLQAAKNNALTDELVAEVEAAVHGADLDYLMDEVPAAIRQSLEGIEQIASIVRAMKAFSHPGTGRKCGVDLNQAIENTLTVCRNEWKYVAELLTDFDSDLPPVYCLPNEINQVVLNLLINASHAIADVVGDGSVRKGRITVRTRRDGDWAEIRVEDTGAGIPEPIQARVFDHFFTTKEVGKGSGQGLAIAHNIVTKKHRGTITFETEVGQGTTFVFRLPIGDPAEAATGPTETMESSRCLATAH